MGDCKHIVAVLLTVDDRNTDVDTPIDSVGESAGSLLVPADVEGLVEETTA